MKRSVVLGALAFATMLGMAFVPLDTAAPDVWNSGDVTFDAYMSKHLGTLVDSTEQVAAMVESRSRNVLALRAKSSTIESIIDDVDAYLRDRPLTGCEPAVAEAYHQGSDLVLEVIALARRALGSFDFTALPAGVPLLAEGRESLKLALSMVEPVDSATTVVHCSRRVSVEMPRTGIG